ncbi:unnamed protein product [Sphenostylis stenocarpa]|uniref:Uncharacterized protein n=1 Tax=Sphenostylis stenocarpa TaxID=92480 RepID=A0AA86SPZ6_9FABA|nr:unnamed protein product [Sphenostylis stenocarpa]
MVEKVFTDQVERMKIVGRWFSQLWKRREEERLRAEEDAWENDDGGADGSWHRVRESEARWLVVVGERWLARGGLRVRGIANGGCCWMKMKWLGSGGVRYQ